MKGKRKIHRYWGKKPFSTPGYSQAASPDDCFQHKAVPMPCSNNTMPWTAHTASARAMTTHAYFYHSLLVPLQPLDDLARPPHTPNHHQRAAAARPASTGPKLRWLSPALRLLAQRTTSVRARSPTPRALRTPPPGYRLCREREAFHSPVATLQSAQAAVCGTPARG